MPSARLDCGCRRRSARRKGHRPGCLYWDIDRYNERRAKAQIRRKLEHTDTYRSNLPGVILYR